MATQQTSPVWTTADLAAVYTTHSHALITRALRYVHDQQVAEDIVQEAFIKLMLAAPDLNDREHLIAYLQTTVTNLSLNFRRDNGRRPLLVAVDSEATQSDIAAIAAESHIDLDADLTRADDAAIVREAISRLTEADRMIILAVDVAEKSVAELAAEYGMKEASVHNAISRARRNLRTILETWVIDEETGMTAAQFLSKTYKKAAENSKKIGTAALSLILLASAFLGFWNNPTQTPLQVASPTITSIPQTPTSSPTQSTVADPTTTSTPSQTSSAPATKHNPPLQTWALDYLSKAGPLGWPGLDPNGIPVGFTVNNGAGLNGLALISQDPFVMDTSNGDVSTESRFTTFQDGLNVILSQKITNVFGRVSYEVHPMVRIGGSWIDLTIASTSTAIKVLDNGTYLITTWMIVDLDKTAKNTPIAGVGLGTDVEHIPAVIATRLLTTSIGAPVIAQAVQVLDPLAGQS